MDNFFQFFKQIIENSVDPDQLASSEASWSGSTLFFIHVQSWFMIIWNVLINKICYCWVVESQSMVFQKKLAQKHAVPMGDSSQFSPLTTLSEQLGPNSWVSSVFIPAFIANIGKHFFLKYDSEYSKSI